MKNNNYARYNFVRQPLSNAMFGSWQPAMTVQFDLRMRTNSLRITYTRRLDVCVLVFDSQRIRYVCRHDSRVDTPYPSCVSCQEIRGSRALYIGVNIKNTFWFTISCVASTELKRLPANCKSRLWIHSMIEYLWYIDVTIQILFTSQQTFHSCHRTE